MTENADDRTLLWLATVIGAVAIVAGIVIVL